MHNDANDVSHGSVLSGNYRPDDDPNGRTIVYFANLGIGLGTGIAVEKRFVIGRGSRARERFEKTVGELLSKRKYAPAVTSDFVSTYSTACALSRRHNFETRV